MQFPGVPTSADDNKQATTYCVERWAARLASAADTASEVAEAVIANCDGAIGAYETAKIRERVGPNMTSEEARDYWLKRAKFIVVQTRAGHCYPNA